MPSRGMYQPRPPGEADDSAAGWQPGDEWQDTVTGKLYKCLRSTVGAAVWFDLEASGGSGPHTHPWADISGAPSTYPPDPHTHPQNDVVGLTSILAAKASLVSGKVPLTELGGAGADNTKYLRGDGTWATPAGGGTIYGQQVLLHHPLMAASAAATNLAANAWNAISDPSFRQMVDLRGMTKVRIQGRIGGTVASVTRLRLQYHVGGNVAVATGDAGWTLLAESAGGHVAGTMFFSAEAAVPAGAQINPCLVRCGLWSGDGVADPTISCCILVFYP